MNLSKRVSVLQPSTTLATAAKAKALKSAGKDVIDLTLGEPDFHTPENIQQAAVSAITDGDASFYTPSAGLPALRQAIIDRTEKDYGLRYEIDQVVVTDGAKFALYALFQTIINDGDEVLIPTPYWVSYGAQIELAGGKPVYIETTINQNYKVSIEQLEANRTANTKAMVLNTPANPSGVLYSKEELTKIGEWAVEHDILIVSDDIYGKLVYHSHHFVPIASINESIRRQTVIINGVSKSYAMTGWRIGYALGDQKIIGGMNKVISQSTSNAATVSQYAAIEALSGSQETVEIMREAFQERLDIAFPLVAALPGIKLKKPEGAFYLFPDAEETVKLCGYKQVSEWVNDLLEEEHVAVVAGEGFGAPNNFRISYATDLLLLEQAVERISRFIERKLKENKIK